MFELASLELAGGLFIGESAANSVGQSASALETQSVVLMTLSVGGSGIYLPTIQGIKFGDSDLLIDGTGTSQYGTVAFGTSACSSIGLGDLAGLGGAYAKSDIAAYGSTALDIKVQAVSLATHSSAGASSTTIGLQAYGGQTLRASGVGQLAAGGVRIYDTTHSASGVAVTGLAFGAHGEARHAISGTGSSDYTGQCTIRSGLACAGRTTSALTSARVFDGRYQLLGAGRMDGVLCAYGDQQLSIYGISAATPVATNALRHGHLAKSYDVSVRAMEPRGTIKPYEARKTVKPTDSRGVVVPAQPRHSQWSGA